MSSSKLQQKLDKEVEFHRFADNYVWKPLQSDEHA